MNIEALLSERSLSVDWSGIRRAAALGKGRPNAVNLTLGQPEFAVPDAIKSAAIEAIRSNRNGYTANPGLDELRAELAPRMKRDCGWTTDGPSPDAGLMITSGTSGGLFLALMALLGPGDEIVFPDPYFVAYPHMASMCSAKAVICDTAPDFRLTAERVERVLTKRTKIVLFNSPGNPTGVITSERDCADLLDLAKRKNLILISDEIYDEFTFSESRTQLIHDGSARACPSPARGATSSENVLLIRGFGKTYGVTGWRLGYAAGPKRLIEEMTKLQQYTFVCPPTPLQYGAIAALHVDISDLVARYERRRDLAVKMLGDVTEVVSPGGAFYIYPKIPAKLNMTGSQFAQACVERDVLLIPGNVFSQHDTHIRISLTAPDDRLATGLEIIRGLMRG